MKGAHRFLGHLINTKIQSNIIQGVEIGVWKGELSEYLLSNFDNMMLYMVDFYLPACTNGKWEQKDITEAMVLAHSRTLDFADRRIFITADSSKTSELFKKESLDFIYIDGDHSYEGVKKDLIKWYPIIKSGGLMVGHDYNGKMDKKGTFGVKKAVDEFGIETNHVITISKHLVWWFIK